MVSKALLGWKREVKGLWWSCAYRPVLGVTGAALEPKAGGGTACPPPEKCRSFVLSPVLYEEAEQFSNYIYCQKLKKKKGKKKVTAAERTKCSLCGHLLWEDQGSPPIYLLLQACGAAGSAVQGAPGV